ncbi:MAG TPA: hypothetical protein VIW22_07510 [Nitrososphaerales archaeon]
MTAPGESVSSPRFIRGVSSRVETMEKLIPPFNEISFWLIVNVVFFIYIGLFQLVNGNGPISYVAGGSYLSAGAVVLGIVYLLLWMLRRTRRKIADRWIMMLSGLAVLGDLIFVAGPSFGSFSGDSAILDVLGLLLFRATYQDYRSPA